MGKDAVAPVSTDFLLTVRAVICSAADGCVYDVTIVTLEAPAGMVARVVPSRPGPGAVRSTVVAVGYVAGAAPLHNDTSTTKGVPTAARTAGSDAAGTPVSCSAIAGSVWAATVTDVGGGTFVADAAS